ncbi:MAG: CDP-alcohol phosphatidyltransferase family protein [Candidatus Competibacteraceae bacterium]
MALLPLRPRDIPNLITGLRIMLVVPILWLLLEERYGATLLLFVMAAFSDALDGFLAKYFDWTSELGGILDPLADKLLLIGTILTLGWLGKLPVWLVVLVVLRDVIIVCGAISYHMLIGQFKAEPLLISKLNTLMQLLLMLAVITNGGIASLPAWLLTGLIGLTALTTSWSGLAYVLRWGWSAWNKGRRKPTSP